MLNLTVVLKAQSSAPVFDMMDAPLSQMNAPTQPAAINDFDIVSAVSHARAPSASTSKNRAQQGVMIT